MAGLIPSPLQPAEVLKTVGKWVFRPGKKKAAEAKKRKRLRK